MDEEDNGEDKPHRLRSSLFGLTPHQIFSKSISKELKQEELGWR
jgi:hypothetical protein